MSKIWYENIRAFLRYRNYRVGIFLCLPYKCVYKLTSRSTRRAQTFADT